MEAAWHRSPYWLPEPVRISRLVSVIVPSFGVLFNTVVSFTLLRVKYVLPTNAALLMFHQALVDGVNSVLFIIVLFPMEPDFARNQFGLLCCVVYVKMVFATDAVAQWNALTISVERYLSICRPLRRSFFTRRRICAMTAFNWTFCALLCYGMGFLYVRLSDDAYCGQDSSSVQLAPVYAMLYSLLFYVVPPATMLFCYGRIIAVTNHSATAFHYTTNHKALLAARRLTRTLIVSSFFLVVTNVPDIVLFMFMYCLFGMDTMSSDSWTYAFQVAAKSFGPVINPIVYSFAIPRFRHAVKFAFCSL